jgi:hypothetical protein
MRTTRQIRAFHKIVLLFVMATLLVAIVVPHHVGSTDAALALVLLVPVFLFGTVIDRERRVPRVLASEGILSPAPVRCSLFQIPPPSLSL